MSEEPVQIQGEGSPSASSDEREGWTTLMPKTVKGTRAENPSPTKQTTTQQKPIYLTLPLRSSTALVLLSAAFILIITSLALHGMLIELRSMGKTIETMAGELGMMHEALDRSLSDQVQIKMQLDELLTTVLAQELADRSPLFTSHQAQIDGQTTSQPDPSVLNCQLLSTSRTFITRAYDASRKFLAHKVLLLVTFLASVNKSA